MTAAAAPLVSVVIPAWRRAASVGAAIRSVLGQDLPADAALEVVVVDDASGDGTAEAAEAVADPRLRVIRRPVNGGAGAARNTGIEAARGRLVAFQDSDDLWLPDKLARQLESLARPSADGRPWAGVYCPLLTVDREARPRAAVALLPPSAALPVEGDLLEPLLAGNFVSTQTLMAPRATLLDLGGFDEALPALEDWELALRLAAAGPLACADEPLAVQRLSANSLTRSAEKRLAAYAMILARHDALFRARPRLLARHCHSLGWGLARLGRAAEARAWRLRALRLDPARPAHWAALFRGARA